MRKKLQLKKEGKWIIASAAVILATAVFVVYMLFFSDAGSKIKEDVILEAGTPITLDVFFDTVPGDAVFLTDISGIDQNVPAIYQLKIGYGNKEAEVVLRIEDHTGPSGEPVPMTVYTNWKMPEAKECVNNLYDLSGVAKIEYQEGQPKFNAGGDFTVSGGCVCAYSTGNDGMDANGNMYIKGGVVYAIGSSSPEMAIDANSEGGKKLYVQGGTLVAIGGLESGASLSQSCYQASGSASTWYALTVGSETFAFKTPSSNASKIIVSGASTPTLYKSVTASGTAIFNGMGYYPATYSGGSSVSLSSYSASSGGGRW